MDKTTTSLTKVTDIIFADSIENLISNTQTRSVSTFTYKNRFNGTGTQNYSNNDVNFIIRITYYNAATPRLDYYILYNPVAAITSTNKTSDSFEFATWLAPTQGTRTKYAFYLKTQSGKIQFMIENNTQNTVKHTYYGYVTTPYSPYNSFVELNNLI